MFTQLKRTKRSSREQIAIQSIDNGILCLPGNRYRAILEVSPINFALKSDEEQEVIIDSFQAFLNALPCSIQIVMRTRAVDMDSYTHTWDERAAQEKDPTYKKQIENYSKFVQQIVTENSVLTRRFYVVVPAAADKIKSKDSDIIRQHILLNCDIITKGLSRIGMQTRMLDSLEVLDLFYSFYNPTRAKIQPLSNLASNVLSEVVA